MRLTNYITEVTKPTLNQVRTLLEKGMCNMFRILEKNSWKMPDRAIIAMLNATYKNNNILFILGSTKKSSVSKYVHSALFISEGLLIAIIMKPGITNAFKKFARPDKKQMFYDIEGNEFFRNISDALAHEMLHKSQVKVSKGKALYADPESADSSLERYYKDPMEIEAHAQEAAVEVIRYDGISKTFAKYKMLFAEEDPKTYKRFMKKMMMYIRKIAK